MSETPPDHNGTAPADVRPRKPWPVWAILLAYFLLAALASVSIWFIDKDAMHVAR